MHPFHPSPYPPPPLPQMPSMLKLLICRRIPSSIGFSGFVGVLKPIINIYFAVWRLLEELGTHPFRGGGQL